MAHPRRPRVGVPARVARRHARSRPSARSRGYSGKSRHRTSYSRGYLPHFDAADAVQALTFRLADSLPTDVIQRWKREIQASPRWRAKKVRDQELRRRIARYEDEGFGECHLRRPEIAVLVRDALLRFDGERYQLREWCVMPNHVHVLLVQMEGHPLAEIVRSWKVYAARRANALLGRRGPFWMRDYHDRGIRDEEHMDRAARYIRNNPVAAGLCARPQDWPWSSAAQGRRGSEGGL